VGAGAGMAGSHAEPDEWALMELFEDGQSGAGPSGSGGGEMVFDSPPPPASSTFSSSSSSRFPSNATFAANQATQPQPSAGAASLRSSQTASTSTTTQKTSAAAQMAGHVGDPSSRTSLELLSLVAARGVGCLSLEVDRRAFNQLLLGEADDFVHVLSLKGSLLYCSRSVRRVLEYEPGCVSRFLSVFLLLER
jgi:hypothetical protein